MGSQFTISSEKPTTERNIHFTRATSGFVVEKHSATVAQFGNKLGASGPYEPVFFQDSIKVTAISGSTLTIPGIDYFQTRPSGFWRTAELLAIRNVGGQAQQVKATTVTAMKAEAVDSPFGDNVIAAGQTTATINNADFNRPNSPIYFAIATCDDNGKRSAWSNIVTYTTGNPIPGGSDAPVGVTVASSPLGARTVDGALPTPAGLTATPVGSGKGVRLDWPSQGSYKVIVGRCYASTFSGEESITVADASGLRTTDAYVLRRKFDHTVPKSEIAHPRIWQAAASIYQFGVLGAKINGQDTISNDSMIAGASFEYRNDGNGPYVRFVVPSGATFEAGSATHGGSLREPFYHVPVPGVDYRLRVKVRVASPKTATIEMQGAVNSTRSVNVTTSWQTFNEIFQFAATPVNTSIYGSFFKIAGPTTVDVELFHAGFAEVEPYVLTAADRAMFLASNAGFLRDHGTPKSRPFSYTMESTLRPIGSPNNLGNMSIAHTLIAAADLRQEAGSGFGPYLQPEIHQSDADLSLFAGYMIDTYNPGTDTPQSKPGAYLRYSHGQVEPWQSVFGKIRVEVGNENWQSGSIPEFYPAPNISGMGGGWSNGALLDRFARALIARPGYDASKWSYYLGLRNSSSLVYGAGGWNNDSLSGSVHADVGGFADYVGGTDSGVTTAPSFDNPGNVFSTVANSNINRFYGMPRDEENRLMAAWAAEWSTHRSKPFKPMHYEAAPGYNLNGLNGAGVTPEQAAAQELIMKSVGAGTATLTAFMCNWANGILSSNFFVLSRGAYWTFAAPIADGGAINAPGQWFGFMNEHLAGTVRQLDILKGTIDPALDQNGVRRGNAIWAFETIREDGTRAYTVANADPFNSHDVTIKASGDWTRHYMTGDMEDSNITFATKDDVQILSQDMGVLSAITLTLAPGKAEVFIEAAA